MALATRCPACHSVFRVVADQLKLRGGLVRCGQCHTVFDAIGALTYLDDAQLRQALGSRPAAAGSDGNPTAPAREPDSEPQTCEPAPAPPAELPERAAAAMRELAAALESVPALSFTPTAASEAAAIESAPSLETEEVAPSADAELVEAEPAEAAAPEPGPTAADELESSPAAARETTAPASDSPPPAQDAASDAVPATLAEPEFLRRAALQERRRRSSRGWAAASVALALVLAVQLLLAFRAEVLMRWPQAQPWLVQLCEHAGCSVNWPTQPEQIAVLASDLQALPGTAALELNVTLRNRAPYPQAWPALELTLNDTRGQVIARKVVLPADYLPAGRADRLAAGEDLAARIFLEVSGPPPAGFLVYPFHL